MAAELCQRHCHISRANPAIGSLPKRPGGLVTGASPRTASALSHSRIDGRPQQVEADIRAQKARFDPRTCLRSLRFYPIHAMPAANAFGRTTLVGAARRMRRKRFCQAMLSLRRPIIG